MRRNYGSETDNYTKMFTPGKGEKTITTFDGRYGRLGIVYVGVGGCVACGESGELIYIDSSEEEYTVVGICRKCVLKHTQPNGEKK